MPNYALHLAISHSTAVNSPLYSTGVIVLVQAEYDSISIQESLTHRKSSYFEYKKKDIEYLLTLSKKNNLRLLTTEKDYFRLKQLGLSEGINYLSVELGIQEEEKFFGEIKNYIK